MVTKNKGIKEAGNLDVLGIKKITQQLFYLQDINMLNSWCVVLDEVLSKSWKTI